MSIKNAILTALALGTVAVYLGMGRGARYLTANFAQAGTSGVETAIEPPEEPTTLKNDLNDKYEHQEVFDAALLKYQIVMSDTRRGTVKEIIDQAAASGVDVTTALRIASCESNFKATAGNPSSTARGIYQFTEGTWEHIKATKSVYNEEYNIAQFMRWYPQHPEWWECK